jgi:hypothetical protein
MSVTLAMVPRGSVRLAALAAAGSIGAPFAISRAANLPA